MNPGETSIVIADQPLFEMPKQIHWKWPNFYGKDKFIVMFGGLHIEMTCYKTLGDILRDRGWTCCLTKANIATPRTADSFYVCSNVLRTRQAHQTTESILLKTC